MKALKLKSSTDDKPEWLLVENQTLFTWPIPTLFNDSETIEDVLHLVGSDYEDFISNYEWVTIELTIKR